MNRFLSLIVALFLTDPASAHEITVGDLQIIHPYIPAPAASAKTAGGYMAIVNTGSEMDRLIGVETGIAAKVMVHESKVGADGVGTMVHVPALDIPADETVSLEPGRLHIMLMGLTGPLTEGEVHKATLIFERAGRVEVEFLVDRPASPEDETASDHEVMGHSHDSD